MPRASRIWKVDRTTQRGEEKSSSSGRSKRGRGTAGQETREIGAWRANTVKDKASRGGRRTGTEAGSKETGGKNR